LEARLTIRYAFLPLKIDNGMDSSGLWMDLTEYSKIEEQTVSSAQRRMTQWRLTVVKGI
jgi:hypothetical protein